MSVMSEKGASRAAARFAKFCVVLKMPKVVHYRGSTMKREALKPDPWPDDKAWLDLLAPLFKEDARKAESAAKLWHRLLIEIESGEEGATRVAWCLEDALRLPSSSPTCIEHA